MNRDDDDFDEGFDSVVTIWDLKSSEEVSSGIKRLILTHILVLYDLIYRNIYWECPGRRSGAGPLCPWWGGSGAPPPGSRWPRSTRRTVRGRAADRGWGERSLGVATSAGAEKGWQRAFFINITDAFHLLGALSILTSCWDFISPLLLLSFLLTYL